jgi:hypothetical protein
MYYVTTALFVVCMVGTVLIMAAVLCTVAWDYIREYYNRTYSYVLIGRGNKSHTPWCPCAKRHPSHVRRYRSVSMLTQWSRHSHLYRTTQEEHIPCDVCGGHMTLGHDDHHVW